jgi:hypothetical protein
MFIVLNAAVSAGWWTSPFNFMESANLGLSERRFVSCVRVKPLVLEVSRPQ